MSRRRKAQAFVEQAHTTFTNENAKLYSANSKIETTKYIRSVNVHQKQFVKSIKNNILTLGSGPSGVGKTLLALFTGIELINNPESSIEKIIYVRAAVDVRQEKDIIGILPGGKTEKLSLLTYPIYDNTELFLKKPTLEALIEKETISAIPLGMLRGRSFSNCLVIADEIQNMTKDSLKTLITRVGETSKLVLIGDPTQCDIDFFKNGLVDLEWRLNKKLNTPITEENKYQAQVEFSVIHFDYDDILRSELTKFAIDLYNIA